MGDEKRITLKIDINSGTIELDAPVENFDQAIEKTKELTGSLNLGQRRRPVDDSGMNSAAAKSESVQPASAALRAKARTKSPSTSAVRPGRIGSFEPIRDLLDEEQQKTLRDFVAAKAPDEQGDQVQVVMHKGAELLGRQGFNFNELYTLLWRAGVELPKALDVVVQRLMQEQKVEKGEGGYFLKFIGRNYVEQNLPKSKPTS